MIHNTSCYIYFFQISCSTDVDEDVYCEDGYILKIANKLEDPEALKAQNELMLHLHENTNLQVMDSFLVDESLIPLKNIICGNK